MNIKPMLLAASVIVGSVSSVSAQTAAQTAIATAAIEQATATCASSPADCAAAVRAALAAMAEAGITGAALDGALGQLASALTEIGAELPAVVQAEIADALDEILASLSPDSPLRDAIEEITAALEDGNGAEITAEIASPS